jgi:hypothetical protein
MDEVRNVWPAWREAPPTTGMPAAKPRSDQLSLLWSNALGLTD